MQFPDHIVVKIAEHLQLKEILQLKLVSKQYKTALHNNVLWRQVYVSIMKEGGQNLNENLNFYSIIKQLYKDTDWKYHLEIILNRFDDSPLISKMYQQFPDSNLPFHMERFNRCIQALEQFNYTSMGVNKRLFGGYKFYDKIFTFKPLQLKPYPQDPRHNSDRIVDRLSKHPWVWKGDYIQFYRNCIQKLLKYKNTDSKIIHVQNLSIKSFLDARVISKEKYKKDASVLYIDIMDTLQNPDSDTTTRGIRIRATSKYVPIVDHEQQMFMYQIRISDGGVEGDFQLTSRRWVIQQGSQVLPTIQGPGVIGEYPKIYPGCSDFVYESCSPTNQWQSSMSGGFSFQNLSTGEIFEAQVQSFPLALKKEEKVILLKNNNHSLIIAQY